MSVEEGETTARCRSGGRDRRGDEGTRAITNVPRRRVPGAGLSGPACKRSLDRARVHRGDPNRACGCGQGPDEVATRLSCGAVRGRMRSRPVRVASTGSSQTDSGRGAVRAGQG